MPAAPAHPAKTSVLPKARRRLVDSRTRRMVVVAGILVGVFAILALLLREAEGTSLDYAITRAVQQMNSPAMSALMLAVSAPGY